jgi:hypothetical protein
MQTVTSRVGRGSLAFGLLGLIALGACSDEPTPLTAPASPTSASPNQNVTGGNVVMVTNTLGNGAFGSLLWATYLAANAGDTIRFDPSIAGDTIFMDNTLVVLNRVVIDGPKDKGIYISGRNAVRVMDIRQGARLRNLNIMDGYHPQYGGGILAAGTVDLENTAVFNNDAPVGAGMYVFDAVLVNSTVADNYDGTGNFGPGAAISYDYHGGLILDNSTIGYNTGSSALAPHGVRDRIPSVTLRNSIIVGGRVNCYDAIGFRYAGRNLVTDATCGDDPFEPTMIYHDLAGWYLTFMDPHGGPTHTILPKVGSLAINNGKNCTVSLDQRYMPRDAKCDIGAAEFTDFTTVTLAVNATVNVDLATGGAVLTGSTRCSANGPDRQPNSLPLRVKLTQEQKGGRTPTTVSGETTVTVPCSPTATGWSVSLPALPSDKQWQNGAAVAQVATEGTPEWITPASLSSPVKVVRPRK